MEPRTTTASRNGSVSYALEVTFHPFNTKSSVGTANYELNYSEVTQSMDTRPRAGTDDSGCLHGRKSRLRSRTETRDTYVTRQGSCIDGDANNQDQRQPGVKFSYSDPGVQFSYSEEGSDDSHVFDTNTLTVADTNIEETLQAKTYGAVTTASAAEVEIEEAIQGRYFLYFKDSVLESRYAEHVWENTTRMLCLTWLVGTVMIMGNWLPYFATKKMSFAVPDVALSCAILLQLLCFQVLPLLPRMSHAWVPPDAKLIAVVTLALMMANFSSVHRCGIIFADDPGYFLDDHHRCSSDVFITLALVGGQAYFFIFFPLRCSRGWLSPVAVLITYCVSSSPNLSPHTISEIIIIIPSVAAFFTWFWNGRRYLELQERKSWYRINLLSAHVENLMMSLQNELHDDRYESQTANLLRSLTQALEERNETDIYALQQELLAHGLSEDDVQEKHQAICKTLSEEAGVSVAYLISKEFEQLAQLSTGKQDPTFHEMKDAFFFKDEIGKFVKCPRDGRDGCALVDTLPFQHRRKATHFLSWLWQYNLSTVRSSLVEWLHGEGLDADQVFLYMCFFVNNQYRILVEGVAQGSDNLGEIFESNLRRTQKVVAIFEGWDSPSYLDRIWTIFEQFTAISLGIGVTIIMPPGAVSTLISEFERGRRGIIYVKDALSRVDSLSAKATVAEDEIRVKQAISEGVGFDAVNKSISGFMIEWVALQLQTYMNRIVHQGTDSRSVGSHSHCVSVGSRSEGSRSMSGIPTLSRKLRLGSIISI